MGIRPIWPSPLEFITIFFYCGCVISRFAQLRLTWFKTFFVRIKIAVYRKTKCVGYSMKHGLCDIIYGEPHIPQS